jgi:hypothetical protein
LVRCYIATEHLMLLPYTVFVFGKREVDTVDPLLLQWLNFFDTLLLRIDDEIGPWVHTVPYISFVG